VTIACDHSLGILPTDMINEKMSDKGPIYDTVSSFLKEQWREAVRTAGAANFELLYGSVNSTDSMSTVQPSIMLKMISWRLQATKSFNSCMSYRILLVVDALCYELNVRNQRAYSTELANICCRVINGIM